MKPHTPTSEPHEAGLEDDQAAELLRAHLDRELDAEGEVMFDALTKDRPELLEEARALETMLSAVKALADEPAPSGFYERVDRRLRQRQILEGDWFTSSLFSFSFQIVSVLILLGIAVAAVLMQLEDERPMKLERAPTQLEQAPDSGDPAGTAEREKITAEAAGAGASTSAPTAVPPSGLDSPAPTAASPPETSPPQGQ